MSSKTDNLLLIPGEAVLAMLMAMIDVRSWLEMEIIRKWLPHKEERERKTLREAVAILPSPETVSVQLLDMEPLSGPFGAFTRFFRIYATNEKNIYEFKLATNRRIYGLVSALTGREIEILRKRLIERKSVTDTATEMNITPQAVSAFMSAIRRKVQKYLFAEK